MRKGLFRKQKTAQTWAADVLFAAGLFLVAFVVFFYILTISSESTSTEALKEQGASLSRLILSGTSNSTITFVSDNAVVIERLKQLANLSYKQIKALTGAKHDFCIYFEDSSGNLINLSQVTGSGAVGIGSPNATVSGSRCGN